MEQHNQRSVGKGTWILYYIEMVPCNKKYIRGRMVNGYLHIRRTTVWGQSTQTVQETPISKITTAKWTGMWLKW
jgi:hypothetical protein